MFGINKETIAQSCGEGVTRKILTHTKALMMVEVTFAQGAVGSMHSHPHLQISYIAKGSFEVTIGDEKKILQVGDSFLVPSELAHGVVALEESVIIDVFNPMREDFIEIGL